MSEGVGPNLPTQEQIKDNSLLLRLEIASRRRSSFTFQDCWRPCSPPTPPLQVFVFHFFPQVWNEFLTHSKSFLHFSLTFVKMFLTAYSHIWTVVLIKASFAFGYHQPYNIIKLGMAWEAWGLFLFFIILFFPFTFYSHLSFLKPLRNFGSKFKLFFQSHKNTELLSLFRKGRRFYGVLCLCSLCVMAPGARILSQLHNWVMLCHNVFLLTHFWINLPFFKHQIPYQCLPLFYVDGLH